MDTEGDTSTGEGPHAQGPAAFGLRTAWKHVQAQGQVAQPRSVTWPAGQEEQGKITAYCATVLHAGASVTDKSAIRPSGESATRRMS